MIPEAISKYREKVCSCLLLVQFQVLCSVSFWTIHGSVIVIFELLRMIPVLIPVGVANRQSNYRDFSVENNSNT